MEKLFRGTLPGLGKILNGKLIKGFVLTPQELIINVQANFNNVIMLSLHEDIKSAIDQTHYQWLMFYPCLYLFAIWDTFKDDGGGKKHLFLSSVAFEAYLGTIGLIYPFHFCIWILFGPLQLPILSSTILGLLIAFY